LGLLGGSRNNSFFKARAIGVVIEIYIKYPEGPLRMEVADVCRVLYAYPYLELPWH
jgi:hypothetical protein